MGKIGATGIVYFGEYTHTLDREGRLALPARLREAVGKALSDGLVLTCGAEPCLVAYTQERFGAMLSALATDPGISKSAAREFKRALGGRTAVVVADKQGRILIPEALRTAAHITKEVVVVGAVDAIEIWDPAAFRARAANRQVAFESVVSRIFD